MTTRWDDFQKNIKKIHKQLKTRLHCFSYVLGVQMCTNKESDIIRFRSECKHVWLTSFKIPSESIQYPIRFREILRLKWIRFKSDFELILTKLWQFLLDFSVNLDMFFVNSVYNPLSTSILPVGFCFDYNLMDLINSIWFGQYPIFR